MLQHVDAQHRVPEEQAIQTPIALSSGLSFDEAELRQFGYQIMDQVAAYLSGISERPVWQPMPEHVHSAIREQELPAEGQAFEESLAFIEQMILPYPQGNGHPRFAGWINSAPAHAAVLIKPLVAAMQQRGCAFLTSTPFQGKETLRACIVNYMTAEADIQAIVDETVLVGDTLTLPAG